jgi:hypothetical protein
MKKLYLIFILCFSTSHADIINISTTKDVTNETTVKRLALDYYYRTDGSIRYVIRTRRCSDNHGSVVWSLRTIDSKNDTFENDTFIFN